MQLAEERVQRDKDRHIWEHLGRQNNQDQAASSTKLETGQYVTCWSGSQQRQKCGENAYDKAILEILYEALLILWQNLIAVERRCMWPPRRWILKRFQLRLDRG